MFLLNFYPSFNFILLYGDRMFSSANYHLKTPHFFPVFRISHRLCLDLVFLLFLNSVGDFWYNSVQADRIIALPQATYPTIIPLIYTFCLAWTSLNLILSVLQLQNWMKHAKILWINFFCIQILCYRFTFRGIH